MTHATLFSRFAYRRLSGRSLLSLAVGCLLILMIGVSAVSACACNAIVTGTKTVSGTFEEGGTVSYTIVLTNIGDEDQNDNTGSEFSDVLPAQLTLVSASATSGTAVATVGTNTVTWNGSLAPYTGSVTITITATINAGTSGQTISNQGTINYDYDYNNTNESTDVTDDPGVGGLTDPTSFVVGGGVTSASAPPPGTPLCEDQNFDENGVIHASTSDAFGNAINCRVLYDNGAPAKWQGAALYSSANIGVPGIVELGIQQAVDIFSPSGQTYFEGGAVFCLKGEGTLIWLAASGMPRHAEIIGSYTVPEFPGFTCATLFEPGTLVLVTQVPLS